ncbi:MAG: lytic transglycosylase domain-containing protein [Leptospiraceae bacterium]|nr:lytic transglycosylase domain-containing protein [Leptospiraceae bacterium]
MRQLDDGPRLPEGAAKIALQKTPALDEQNPVGMQTASQTTPPARQISFAAELNQIIESESARAKVNPDLVRAVIKAESNGNPAAVSKAGAIGLMQLMPDTARQLGVNPHDPRQNVRGGIEYLKNMAQRYQNLDQTLAAYNAGPGNVDRHNGIPPFQETRGYIDRIRKSLFDTQG